MVGSVPFYSLYMHAWVIIYSISTRCKDILHDFTFVVCWLFRSRIIRWRWRWDERDSYYPINAELHNITLTKSWRFIYIHNILEKNCRIDCHILLVHSGQKCLGWVIFGWYQGNHQNSLLTNKLWRVFVRIKQKKKNKFEKINSK